MIKRVVCMPLLPGTETAFLEYFDKVKQDIRHREGCLGLEILRREEDGLVQIWTISMWRSETFLEAYRASSLFEQTWKAVKPLFAAKASAWTLTPIEDIL